jgi:hypothetical protein
VRQGDRALRWALHAGCLRGAGATHPGGQGRSAPQPTPEATRPGLRRRVEGLPGCGRSHRPLAAGGASRTQAAGGRGGGYVRRSGRRRPVARTRFSPDGEGQRRTAGVRLRAMDLVMPAAFGTTPSCLAVSWNSEVTREPFDRGGVSAPG